MRKPKFKRKQLVHVNGRKDSICMIIKVLKYKHANAYLVSSGPMTYTIGETNLEKADVKGTLLTVLKQ